MPREKNCRDLVISKDDKCSDRRCDTIKLSREISCQNIPHKKVCVKKVLDCDEIKCKDCAVNKGQCPIHVKQRNVKILLKQDNKSLSGDEIDVYLKKPKAKCQVPKVHVNVAAPEVIHSPQHISVEIEKGSLKKGKPIVRVHCPEADCHVLKPKVCVTIEKAGKVCLPPPIVTVKCVDKCKKEKYTDGCKKEKCKKRRSSTSC